MSTAPGRAKGRIIDLDAEDDFDPEEDNQEVTYGLAHSQQPEASQTFDSQLTLKFTQDSQSTNDANKNKMIERVHRRREARKRRMEPKRLELYSETNDNFHTNSIDHDQGSSPLTNDEVAPTNPLNSLKSLLENERQKNDAFGTENRINDSTVNDTNLSLGNNIDTDFAEMEELPASGQLHPNPQRPIPQETQPRFSTSSDAPPKQRSWSHRSNDDGFGNNILSKSRRAFDKLKSKEQNKTRKGLNPVGTRRSKAVESAQKTAATSSRTRAKPEFVESENGNGMMIPKHWGLGNSTQSAKGELKKKVAAPARSIEKKSRRLSPDPQPQPSSKKKAAAPASRSIEKKSQRLSPDPQPQPSSKRRRSVLVQPAHLRGSKTSLSPKPFPKSAPISDSLSVSFAPSFLSTAPSTVAQDPVVDQTFDDRDERLRNRSTPTANMQESERSTQPAPGPTALQCDIDDSGDEHEKTKIGKWSMRYKQMNNALRTDNLRMKSSSIGGDPMDPRRRATSYSDITVLSGEIVPWSSESPEGSTVFAFLQKHAESGSPLDRKQGLAWCFLPSSVVREHSLQPGTHLRLYNSIVFERPSNCKGPGNVCFTIISSTIVGPYPTNCPPMTDLQELLKEKALEHLVGTESNEHQTADNSEPQKT